VAGIHPVAERCAPAGRSNASWWPKAQAAELQEIIDLARQGSIPLRF